MLLPIASKRVAATEGMIASQMLACHDATMECYAHALNSYVTSSLRREHLSQANKRSRTYAVLLDALNRHRATTSRRKVGALLRAARKLVRAQREGG
jgi:hypothetical protein